VLQQMLATPWVDLETDKAVCSCLMLQVCEQCPAVKLEREQEVLTVTVEPGMTDGHVSTNAGPWHSASLGCMSACCQVKWQVSILPTGSLCGSTWL
jgi:hypothetical protein